MNGFPFAVHHFSDPTALIAAAAAQVILRLQETTQRQSQVHWVLTGGRTVADLYAALVGQDDFRQLPWDRIHLWWSDERCVTADDPLSNYRIAAEGLLPWIPIPTAHIHRIPAELPPLAAAARYDTEIRQFIPEGQIPAFDLVLLGMGADGHIASLFPGRRLDPIPGAWVVAVEAPTTVAPHIPRISLSLPALTTARHLLVMAPGNEKAAVLKQVMADWPVSQTAYPVAQLKAQETCSWYASSSL